MRYRPPSNFSVKSFPMNQTMLKRNIFIYKYRHRDRQENIFLNEKLTKIKNIQNDLMRTSLWGTPIVFYRPSSFEFVLGQVWSIRIYVVWYFYDVRLDWTIFDAIIALLIYILCFRSHNWFTIICLTF